MLTDLPAWTEAWRNATEEMGRVSDTAYWDRRAEDYDDFIRASAFAYGEAMAELLDAAGCLPGGAQVLEIASGVGAVTLPLARRAGRVIAYEPASGMADRLAANAAAKGLANIDIRRELFEPETAAAREPCDLVLLCHAAWQFPDLPGLIEAMERASRGVCCLADTVGRTDAATAAMHERLGLPRSAAEDRTFYLFNLLYLSGRLPRLDYAPWTMRRSAASAATMWRMVLGKYREPGERDLAAIERHVAERSRGGVYETPSVMAVLWWPAAAAQRWGLRRDPARTSKCPKSAALPNRLALPGRIPPRQTNRWITRSLHLMRHASGCASQPLLKPQRESSLLHFAALHQVLQHRAIDGFTPNDSA